MAGQCGFWCRLMRWLGLSSAQADEGGGPTTGSPSTAPDAPDSTTSTPADATPAEDARPDAPPSTPTRQTPSTPPTVFDRAFDRMIELEGGLTLHEVPGDRGGMTYAGIARNYWPEWEGWTYIDAGETPPVELVKAFYREQFWQPLKADHIDDPRHAIALFCSAVNLGVRQAARLAQRASDTHPDGIIGPVTLRGINTTPCFLHRFTIEKVKYYADLCTRHSSQKKFLLGWINRALKEGDHL